MLLVYCQGTFAQSFALLLIQAHATRSKKALQLWLGMWGVLLASLGSIHAQTTTVDRDKLWLPAKYIPQSPTVSALPRFDAQQLVQLHSGAAQYFIPLVSVTHGSLSLPVSLSYSYGGLRVSQPDNLVGLGWTL